MDSIEEKILQLQGPVFIFGASGFIGSNLLDTILKTRKDCYAITHNPRSAWRLKLLDVPTENILHCDINYRKSIETIFNEYRPKTIFNLSAYGAYSKQNNTSLIYETNIIGTVNILEVCKDVKAYINEFFDLNKEIRQYLNTINTSLNVSTNELKKTNL